MYNATMIQKREVHIMKQLFFSPIGVVVLLVMLFVLAKANYSLYVRNEAARENRATLQRELTMMEHRRERLVATLGRIGTEKGEEIALRGQYDVGKAGEEMIVVLNQETSARQNIPVETFWSRIRAFIPFL